MHPIERCHRLALIFLLFILGYVSIAFSETAFGPSYIQGSAVNLRSAPSTSSAIISVLSKGQPCEILDRQNDWFYIKLSDDLAGWVFGPYVTFTPVLSDASSISRNEQIVRYALTLLKTKYRYGGNSPNGFDCSGFTRYVYTQFGHILPHKASEQMKYGQPVEKDALQKGDLVFFKTQGAQIVNHVGIYMENGQFIHASSGAGYVTISPLTSGYYHPRYQGARRIFQTHSEVIKK